MPKDPQRAPETGAAPTGTSNADKARALIAMLESGGGAGAEGVPAARLRDWARDLVETVERAKAPASGAAPVAAPAPAADPAPAAALTAKPEPRLTASRQAAPRLFTKAPPVLVDRVPPVATPADTPATPPAAAPAATVSPPVAPPPVAPPSAYRPAPIAAPAYQAARASAARPMSGAPVPHAPVRPQATAPAHAAILPRQDVDRIVASTLDPAGDPGALGREHPAVVALTLLGKPTLQQAAVLRALPGPQMRAVHRALRLLEARER